MEKVDRTKLALISYAIATEDDAVSMYRFMIRTLGPECRKVLVHILNEEIEHGRMLAKLLHGRYNSEE